SESKLPEFPAFEFTTVPASHVWIGKVHLQANYMQALEGSIDSSHVSFLHSTPHGKMTQGGGGVKRNNKLQKYWFEHKNPKFFMKENDHGILIGARRPAEEDTYFWRITNWLTPYYSIIPAEIG